MANLSPCLVGVEAGGGAHYWARLFSAMGHTVKMMSPQFVKPYVKSNKNDANDAEAIWEAVTRPTMRFVPIKNMAQQDVLLLHRAKELAVKQRTAQANQIRGFLAEYGINRNGPIKGGKWSKKGPLYLNRIETHGEKDRHHGQ